MHNYFPSQNGAYKKAPFIMKKYKIYKQVNNEKIVCVCLQSNKRCEKPCKKDVMLYDEYYGWRETFKNHGAITL